MPTATTESFELESLSPATRPMRKVWTRAECQTLARIELFQPQRLELIEGDLIDKMSKGLLHSLTVSLLLDWLAAIFGLRFVQQERAIDVAPPDNPTSEPEPDLVVLARPVTGFAKRRPGPGDIRLVIEVADTSLRFDLSTKARLYATAGFPEYWVADIRNRSLHVHRDPSGGRYRSTLVYSAGENVTPLAAPEAILLVADIFADPDQDPA